MRFLKFSGFFLQESRFLNTNSLNRVSRNGVPVYCWTVLCYTQYLPLAVIKYSGPTQIYEEVVELTTIYQIIFKKFSTTDPQTGFQKN